MPDTKQVTKPERRKASPCVPDETPGYTSANPTADWLRFQEAVRVAVTVPKEAVDAAMEIEQEQRATKRGKK